MTFEQVFKKDKSIDWEIFLSRHRELPPLYANLIISSQYPKEHLQKSIGVDFAFRRFKRVGNEYFWSIKERENLRAFLGKKQTKDYLYFRKVVDRVEKHCHELLSLCYKISKANYKDKSNSDLLRILEIYWTKLRQTASFMVAKHVLNQVLEERIKKKLSKLLTAQGQESKLLEYFQTMLVIKQPTLIGQANKELGVLANKKKVSDNEIKNWLTKYNWIETLCWSGKLLKVIDVRNEINQLKREKRAKIKGDDARKRFNKLKQQLNIKRDLLEETTTLQKLMYVHTFEIECLFAARYICSNFLDIIGSRLGLIGDDYLYLTYSELVQGLKGQKVNKTPILQRRGNRYALIRFDNDISIWQGKAWRELLRNTKSKIQKVSAVTGKPAFLGQVKGIAKIVRSVQEIGKLKAEEILITPMTTIDFTPYLDRTSAIVTDEGGITCHAAIVSRELKIPCVIGTKIATKIFKDGDMVEVDAERGIVRKILS